QDMGAAGLTCSTMEMASRGGTGIEIDLAKVPQRETGMTPYEIMLSESQERMLLDAEKGREHEVLAVFKKWGLDAVVVGHVTEGGIARINNNGRVAAEIPAHPLAEEGPVYYRPIGAPAPKIQTEKDWFAFAPEGTNLTANFVKLLASPAIASKRWITEQYDTSVRTNTLAGPGASDAAVVRIKDPKSGAVKRALALSTDGNGRWCQLNPRVGAMHAVAEAARNVAASGARPIAATNCLNFGSPEKPEVMWQFSETIDGLAEACTVLGTPVAGIVAGEPPVIELTAEKRLQDCLVALAAESAVQSAHDISDGGLAVTLAESCFASVVAGLQTGSFSLGASVQFDDLSPAESVLFGERGARAVVSASPSKLARVLKIARQYHVAARELGKVIREGSFRIEYRGSAVIESSVETLRDAWANSLERTLTAK